MRAELVVARQTFPQFIQPDRVVQRLPLLDSPESRRHLLDSGELSYGPPHLATSSRELNSAVGDERIATYFSAPNISAQMIARTERRDIKIVRYAHAAHTLLELVSYQAGQHVCIEIRHAAGSQ